MENIFLKMFESPHVFTLIVLRISGLVVVSPFFGRFNIPQRVKAGFSLFLGYLIFVSFDFGIDFEEIEFLKYVIFCVQEALIGIIMGFISVLFFSLFAIAGQIMDAQVSFRLDITVDPNTKMKMPLIGNLLTAIAFLVFLELNGHLRLIKLLYESYRIIPITEAKIGTAILGSVNTAFFLTYEIATKIAMPLIIIMLVTEFVLGIIVKFVPQMNVFVVGIPLRILVGLIVLMFLIVPFTHTLDYVFDKMYYYTTETIYNMRG